MFLLQDNNLQITVKGGDAKPYPYTLRTYQKDAVDFMTKHGCALEYDDMG